MARTQTLHPKKFVEAAALPPWYTGELIRRGVIDEAIVKHGARPARVRPVGLAMLLLVDEVSVLVARGTLSAQEAARTFTEIRPKLDDIWDQYRAGAPITIRWEKPDARGELTFLKRAAEQYAAATK